MRQSADRVTRRLALTVALCAVLAVASGCDVMSAMLTNVGYDVGTESDARQATPSNDADYPVPDFRLASLDGGEIGPADYEGEVVVVELWATWCGPCRLQAEFLERLHRDVEGQGVHFLAVSTGEDEATVREYVERKPFPYPVLLDPEDTLGQRYQIYGLPTVMIINGQGAITFLETGVSDVERLRQALVAAGADLA